MIEHTFKPVHIYSGIVKDNDNALEEYNKIIEDFDAKGITYICPESKMKTDYYGFDNPEEIAIQNEEYRFNTWRQFCIKYLRDPLSFLLKELKINNLEFGGIWTQITKGMQLHHPHTHRGNDWSWVWYLDVDPSVHQGTVYYDPTNLNDHVYQAKIEQGKVLMWPSELLHYQPPSNSDIERRILSGNMTEV